MSDKSEAKNKDNVDLNKDKSEHTAQDTSKEANEKESRRKKIEDLIEENESIPDESFDRYDY